MDLLFKTIIGPIVVSIILRLVDKWLNRNRYCLLKKPELIWKLARGLFLPIM
ncbi:type I toxin-antitoxin system Fst family toxin [Streptococcus thermophilus]|uniref:type I toxin-antitoxin system Fst family toxin n=1 Tax=Streptococcus thermophilus TaxID=1308 RepID=UPI0020C5D683|nr:type I toxin-antitoxin system Fst family toxin [Streptococcus thermophilus]